MIAIGSDHAGYILKEEIKKYLDTLEIPYIDFGTDSEEDADYPIYAKKVCMSILRYECEKGILICGTGIGMSIIANKHKGIRAAVCSDTYSAKYTRLHNDANVLTIGSRVIGRGLAREIVRIFLETEFSGGKYQARIDMYES